MGPERGLASLQRLDKRAAVCHVECERVPSHREGDLIGAVSVDVVHADPCSSRGEVLGHGAPDALACPSYEREPSRDALVGDQSTAPALGESTWPTRLVSSTSVKRTAAATSSAESTLFNGSELA